MTNLPRAGRRWFGALTLALTFVLAASGPALAASPDPTDAPEGQPVEVDLPINPTAFVQIEVEGVDRQGNPFTNAGYGVIIDSTGIILAPANLVAPDAPGVAVRYGDWNLAATVQVITVHASPTIGQPASSTYTGKVLAVDGFLDVAVVGLDPAPGISFAFVPASSATRAVGEEVIVVDAGDLVIGGPISPRAWSGQIIEQGADARITEFDPSWMATDVPGPPSAAGALLMVDQSGAAVALPTFNPAYGAQSRVWGWLPAVLNPVMGAAQTGASYTTPYVVAGTGTEAYEAIGWSTALDPCEATDTDIIDSYPAGTNRIAAAFNATGMTEGEDVFNVWWDPVERVIDAVGEFRWVGPSEDCVWAGLNAGEGEAFPNGEHALSVFVGGTLRQVAFVQTEIKADQPAGSVNVVGRVLDADTGEPIEFAFVTVLQPGVDIGEWFDNPNETQVAATAITDADGAYSTEPPVAPGVYGLIIQAFGYQPIGGSLDLTEGGFLPDIALAPLE